VVNQPLSPEVRFALGAGFAGNLRNFVSSGEANSRAAVLASFLSGRIRLSELVPQLFQRQKTELCIFESNFFSFAPRFVFESLPNCRIIYMVRDGRDCAHKLSNQYNPFSDNNLTNLANASIFIATKYGDRYVPWWVAKSEHVHFLNSSPFVRCAWFWKALAIRWREFLEEMGDENRQRIIVVRYEDFVSNPLAAIKSVIRHINRSDVVQIRKRRIVLHPREIGQSLECDHDDLQAATELLAKELTYFGYQHKRDCELCDLGFKRY
jgi:hypothetical protein